MSENYDVYKSRQRRTRTRHAGKESHYSKKLKKQMLFSGICLTLIYFIKIGNFPMGNSINHNIKKALEYRMNTEGITTLLDSFINKENTSEYGDKTNEQTEETSVFKDI